MSFNFKGFESSKNNLNETVVSSKEYIIAKKFTDLLNNGKFADVSFTIDNIAVIKNTILSAKARLAPGDFSVDEVVNELIKSGVIKQAVAPKKIIEVYKTDSEILKGVTMAEVTEEQLRIIEANLLHEEVHKKGIFKNSEELDEIHDKSSNLVENKEVETRAYYNGFVEAGLIKPEGKYSPKEVSDRDFESIGEKVEVFKENAPKDPALYKKYVEAKKIATIVERSLAYCCTKGGWYGERVRIVLTCLFDDIYRGVDEVFLIEKDNDKHDTLGLGVDATFRGLKSELFKKKLFNILQSIRDGHKTKIKYFKDHNGKMMKEFAIPKIILHFDIEDVKEFVDIVKVIGNEGEEERVKSSYLKAKVMNQIINSCRILADFAEESQNSIFRDYHNVINSIKELSWENEEIKDLINVGDNDEVSKQLNFLIEEFKVLEDMKSGGI